MDIQFLSWSHSYFSLNAESKIQDIFTVPMRIGDPSQPVILRFESTGGLGGSVQCDPVRIMYIIHTNHEITE